MRVLTKVYVAAMARLAANLGRHAIHACARRFAQHAIRRATALRARSHRGAAQLFVAEGSVGSIGFIPYFAAAIVVPSWPSVLCVLVIKTSVEIWMRRPPLKAVLNIAAHTTMELVAVTTYSGARRRELARIPNLLISLTSRWLAAGPALVAFFVASVANNMIVYGAIAMSSNRSITEVLHSNANRSGISGSISWRSHWSSFSPGCTRRLVGSRRRRLWVPVLGLRQVHRTNLELEQTNEELLELMVKSIEARDPYTSGHSRRVQQFSLTIARAIGLSERQIEEIGRAALLHDVGKIHEKYAGVLSKQDKLTPEEWAIIQEHPVDGANLVATMTRLRDLVPAVRHHHENWDGTGYPDRIAGETIPLASRIIRFADTIDAMTTDRPYRRPLTEAQVRSEMLRCRGTQFDPTITDRLLASALWPTLFAPASNDRSIAPLVVVNQVSTPAGRNPAVKIVREA